MISLLFLAVVLELIKTAMFYDYFSIFFEASHKKIKYVLYGLAYLVFICNNLYVQPMMAKLCVFLLGIGMIAIMNRGSLNKKILLSIMGCAIWCASELIGQYLVIGANISYNWYLMCISKFISYMVFYSTLVLLRKLYDKREKKELSGQWYLLLIFAVLSIGVIYLIAQESMESDIRVVLVSTFILLMNIVLYYYYQSMLERYVVEQDNLQLKEQMNMYDSQIRANIQNDKEIRAIRHDMKHHIREIRALSKDGKFTEINEYLDELFGAIEETQEIVESGNIALDGVLNYMSAKAESEGVLLSKKIAVPEDIKLEAYDMNIILGNLLDNAIENTTKTNNPSVCIEVKYNQGNLYIIVTNTCKAGIKDVDGHFYSTKSGNHGYGIDNVKNTVDKYDGSMRVTCDNGTFKVRIVLYL